MKAVFDGIGDAFAIVGDAVHEVGSAVSGALTPVGDAIAQVSHDTGLTVALAAASQWLASSGGASGAIDDWLQVDEKNGIVRWIALDGEHEKDEGWLSSDYWQRVTYVRWTACFVKAAHIERNKDSLIIKRENVKAEIWWDEEHYGYAEPNKEAADFERDAREVVNIPIDELKGFGVERASSSELGSRDMRYFVQGRLRYSEHYRIRVESHTLGTALLSRDQSAEGVAREVAFALARVFVGRKSIIEPPKPFAVRGDVIDVLAERKRGADFDPI